MHDIKCSYQMLSNDHIVDQGCSTNIRFDEPSHTGVNIGVRIYTNLCQNYTEKEKLKKY